MDNPKRPSWSLLGLSSSLAALIVFALMACTAMADPGTTAQQTQQQALTAQYSQKLTAARPYPLGAMNDSMERKNLTERLLRMNDPNHIGYVTLLTANGQVVHTYAIQGKVSSTQSQLTTTQNVIVGCTGTYTNCAPTVVDSMGDDGSFGLEEGGPDGVFFFTAAGVLVEWNGLWLYSDAPQDITSTPLVTMDANARPSSTAGQLGG